jgi:eukaryotic-like serine/threonine-protein kinase
MSSAGTDLSGTTLDGRYLLVRRLGEGAMGTVYVAHHRALGRLVAVKVLHPWLASEPKHRQRFMREARAASRIEHPNVVEIVDVATTHEDEDAAYLVMELLEGNDLKAILRRDGPLPWPRARHFLLQAVAALREAHRQGVIHRDIKPANCFVCEAGESGQPERMKLLDFGIAKLGEDPGASHSSSEGKRLTQTGELVGTLAYLAPEFAEGKPASVYTDMYALGIMAYELLTGDVPFRGRNEFQVLARHLNEPPVRPRVLRPRLPEAAESVVLTLLAKKPELRFETMADVEQAILAIPPDAGEGPVVVARGRESSEPVVRRREGSGPKPMGGEGERPVRAPPLGRGPRVGRWARERAPQVEEPLQDTPEPVSSHALYRGVMDDDGEDHDQEPARPREWGTIATVVLLVALLAAGVASVVLRQQGIELSWPWSSPKEPAPEVPRG